MNKNSTTDEPSNSLTSKPPRPRASHSPDIKHRRSTRLLEDPVIQISAEDHTDLPAAETTDLCEEDLARITESIARLDASGDQFDSHHMTSGVDACNETNNVIPHESPGGLAHNHPFLMPRNLPLNVPPSSPNPFSSPLVLDGSMDILAQWRLRRKMEEIHAHHNVVTSGFPISQQKPPGCEHTCLTGPLMSHNCYQPDPSAGSSLCPHCRVKLDNEVYRNASQRLYSASTQTESSKSFQDASVMTISPSPTSERSCSAQLAIPSRSVRVLAKPKLCSAETQTVPQLCASSHLSIRPNHAYLQTPCSPHDNETPFDEDTWQWTSVTSDIQSSPGKAFISTPVENHPPGIPLTKAFDPSPLENSNGVGNDSVYLDAHIVRYLEQAANLGASVSQWKDDPVINELLARRASTLDNLSSVLVELRRRELDVVLKMRSAVA